MLAWIAEQETATRMNPSNGGASSIRRRHACCSSRCPPARPTTGAPVAEGQPSDRHRPHRKRTWATFSVFVEPAPGRTHPSNRAEELRAKEIPR